MIGYFYEPQWFLAQVALKKVALPAYKAGCDADPKKVACDYPPYALNKIAAKTFIDDGSPASKVIKNFTWTNDDQNMVADLLTNKYVGEPDQAKRYAKAAEDWAKANEAKWKAWIPAG
jgi:glycine betaine/proline transport system substrate-binding protein